MSAAGRLRVVVLLLFSLLVSGALGGILAFLVVELIDDDGTARLVEVSPRTVYRPADPAAAGDAPVILYGDTKAGGPVSSAAPVEAGSPAVFQDALDRLGSPPGSETGGPAPASPSTAASPSPAGTATEPETPSASAPSAPGGAAATVTPAGAGAAGPGSGGGPPVLPLLPAGSFGAAVAVDRCVFAPGLRPCPAGVLGRILGGPEPPPPPEPPAHEDPADWLRLTDIWRYLPPFPGPAAGEESTGAAGALTASMFVRRLALITPDEVASASDVPGCVSPAADGVSFLIGTVGSSLTQVYYWPVARSGSRLLDETASAIGRTDYAVDRPIGGRRYEGCVRMTGLRVGITYEVRVFAADRDGNAEWSPIGSFCVPPCLPTGIAPAGVIASHEIEARAWGAYVSVAAPPAAGGLEFYVRSPGDSGWRSSTMLSGYEAGEKLPSPELQPGREYEYRLVFYGRDGRVYESPPGRFRTLRRVVIAKASRMSVILDGDPGDLGELHGLTLSVSPASAGVVCSISPCTQYRDFSGFALFLDGLSGESPVDRDNQTVDVDSGDTIGVLPPYFVMTEPTSDGSVYLRTYAEEYDGPIGLTSDFWDNGYFFLEVRLPAGIGGRPGFGGFDLSRGCELEGAAFSPLTTPRAVVNSWYDGNEDGPWLQPLDLEMCVVEVP